MTGYNDLLQMVFRRSEDNLSSAASKADQQMAELLSPYIDNMVTSLRNGESADAWRTRILEEAQNSADSGAMSKAQLRNLEDVLNGDDFIVRSKALVEFAGFHDAFRAAYNSAATDIDVKALLDQTNIAQVGYPEESIENLIKGFEQTVEARAHRIEARMMRIEKAQNPESTRTLDDVKEDESIVTQAYNEWAERKGEANTRITRQRAAETHISLEENMIAKPSKGFMKRELTDNDLPDRVFGMNMMKEVTRLYATIHASDGFFSGLRAYGAQRQPWLGFGMKSADIEKLMPSKSLRARSNAVTRPVVEFADGLMNDSGVSKALISLDRYILDNIDNLEVDEIKAILDNFATQNADQLQKLQSDLQKLREKTSKFQTNSGDEVGKGHDLLSAQKQAMLDYLQDMEKMVADVASGSGGTNAREILDNAARIRTGRGDVGYFEQSPAGLSKSYYNSFQAQVRATGRVPAEVAVETKDGRVIVNNQANEQAHLANKDNRILVTRQWQEQLIRGFDEGAYNPNAHIDLGESVNLQYLHGENIELGTWDQFLRTFLKRDSNTGELSVDYAGSVETKFNFYDSIIDYINNGYGAEILFQMDRGVRLAQAPGQTFKSPLPTSEGFAKARGDRLAGRGLEAETPTQKYYLDKVEKMLEDIALSSKGAARNYMFFQGVRKNLIDNNRPNEHLGATYSEVFDEATRFSNHSNLGISVPGRNMGLNALKAMGHKVTGYFMGYDSVKISRQNKHGVDTFDFGNRADDYALKLDIEKQGAAKKYIFWGKQDVDDVNGNAPRANTATMVTRGLTRSLTGGVLSKPGLLISGALGAGGATLYAATNYDDEQLALNSAKAGASLASKPWQTVANIVTTPHEVIATGVIGGADALINEKNFFDTYAWNNPLVSTGLEATPDMVPFVDVPFLGNTEGGIVNGFWNFGRENIPEPEPEVRVEGAPEEETQEPTNTTTASLDATKAASTENVRLSGNAQNEIQGKYTALIQKLNDQETALLRTIDARINDKQALLATEPDQADKIADLQKYRDQVTNTVSSAVTDLTAERDVLARQADEMHQYVGRRDISIQNSTDKPAADSLLLEQQGKMAQYKGVALSATQTREQDVQKIIRDLQSGLSTGQPVSNIPTLTALGIIGSTTQPNNGGTTQPNNGGTTQQPNNGGTTQQPNNGGTTQQPNNGGTTQQPNNGGTTQQPNNGGTGQSNGSTPSLSPLQQAQQKAGASEQYFNSVVSSSRNKLNILDQHLDEIEKLKDQLYSEGNTTQADALSRALDTARAGQVAAESTLSDIKAKEQDIRQLREQINALTDNRDINQANSILAQMKIIQEDVKKMGEEINTVGRQVYDDLESSEDLRDHIETQRLINNISGGPNGLIAQTFGSDDPHSQSVAGSYLSLAWKKVNDVGDWWGEAKRNARSQSERNMLNAVETGGGILAGLVIFNMVNKNLFDNQIGGVMKWGILASVVGYFLHRSGKVGDEMAKSSTRNPFQAQTNYGSTSSATPPSGGSGGSGSSARSSHTPFSTRPNSTQNAPDADASNNTANNAVPIRDKTGKVVDHIKVDLSGGIDQMTVQSHAGGVPQGPDSIVVSPAAKAEIANLVVSGQCKYMVPQGQMEGSMTIDRIQNSDGTNLQGPVTVDFTCPAANDPALKDMAAGQ